VSAAPTIFASDVTVHSHSSVSTSDLRSQFNMSLFVQYQYNRKKQQFLDARFFFHIFLTDRSTVCVPWGSWNSTASFSVFSSEQSTLEFFIFFFFIGFVKNKVFGHNLLQNWKASY